ncbi:MAG: LTA synthase family protein [Bacillaceae bacterium]
MSNQEKMKIAIKQLGYLLLLTIFSVIFIEYVFRLSFNEVFHWIQEEPSAFFLNILLFFSFHCVFFAFKRSWVWITLSATLLYFLSIVNYFKLLFKDEVIVFQDFLLLKDINGIFTKYIEFYHIILFILYVVLLVIFSYWLFKKQKGATYTWYLAFFSVPFFFFLPGLAESFQVKADTKDMTQSYSKNGFFYSFFETGEALKVDKPEGYTKENVEKLVKPLTKQASFNGTNVNVIFYQLESFFDPYTLPNITFKEDPIPFFHELQEQFTSGNLHVPVFGGTTVNSELELLTGFTTQGFPPKTVPYVNYLKDKPIESLAHYYRKKGYTTYAIHNHEQTFFSRNKVYKNMGFDYFIGKEGFPKKAYNETNWMKDELIVDVINDAIKKTKNRDFIFSVGVQTHGYYPSVPLYNEKIEFESNHLSEEEKIIFQNYLHEMNEVDSAIKKLIDSANSWGEPTVIVFYGDHLPTLGEHGSFYKNLGFSDKQKFITPYAIWDNIGLEKKDKDLDINMLSTFLLDSLQERGTLMNQFLRVYKEDPYLVEKQSLLQYDLIFGNMYAYKKDKFPYPIKPIRYVLNNPTITHTKETEGGTLVYGKNFIEGIQATVNNRQKPIQFISTNLIFIPETTLKIDDTLQLFLEDSSGNTIYETSYEYKK